MIVLENIKIFRLSLPFAVASGRHGTAPSNCPRRKSAQPKPPPTVTPTIPPISVPQTYHRVPPSIDPHIAPPRPPITPNPRSPKIPPPRERLYRPV
ncbi:hypothetical protein BH11PSE11_BH11PSE11_12540 [soil metagenome]